MPSSLLKLPVTFILYELAYSKCFMYLGITHYWSFCVWFTLLSIMFSGHHSLLSSLLNAQILHETQEAEVVPSILKNLCIFTVLYLNWYFQTIGSYFFFLWFSILFLHGRLSMLIAKCGLCQLNVRCSVL